MLNIFRWTGCLQLIGECCVLVGSLGGLNLLPHGCVLRSVEGLVLCVDGVVLGWRGGRFTVIQQSPTVSHTGIQCASHDCEIQH